MYGYDYNMDEEQLREEELEEAEKMIRGGADTRRLRRRQFRTLGQSDLYKLYRKYGMEPGEAEEFF